MGALVGLGGVALVAAFRGCLHALFSPYCPPSSQVDRSPGSSLRSSLWQVAGVRKPRINTPAPALCLPALRLVAVKHLVSAFHVQDYYFPQGGAMVKDPSGRCRRRERRRFNP